MGTKETGNFRAFSAKTQIKRANKLPFPVFLQFNPHPAPHETGDLGWAPFGNSFKDQFMGGDFNMLGPPGIGKICAEGQPDQGHIKPHVTNNGPGPNDIKKQTACEIHSSDD